MLYNREVKNAIKVAKKVQKAFNVAAKITYQKNTIKAKLAATKVASQWQLY